MQIKYEYVAEMDNNPKINEIFDFLFQKVTETMTTVSGVGTTVIRGERGGER